MKWYLEENLGKFKDLICAITLVKVNKVGFVMSYLLNTYSQSHQLSNYLFYNNGMAFSFTNFEIPTILLF